MSSSPMHLLYAAPGLVLRPGCGPTEHFLAIARALARRPDVRLSLAIGAPLLERDVEQARLPANLGLHWIDRPQDAWALTDSLALGSHPLRYARHCRAVGELARHLLATDAPDVVIERMWGFGGFLGTALQRAGVRLILEENGPPGFEPRQRRLTDLARGVYLAGSRLRARRLYRRADAILVQAEGLRQRLVRHYGAPAGRVQVVPNAVDPSFLEHPATEDCARRERETLALPPHAPVLFYGGSLDRSHPILAVAEAFLGSRARQDGVQLVVLGSGYERRRLRALAAGLPELRVEEQRPPLELVHWLCAADLALAPYAEGLVEAGAFCFSPLKVREAMALERAAAVTRGAGEELIEHGVNGFLIDGGRPGWQALFDALPDRTRLRALGAGNRRRVACYTYDHVAERYADVARNGAVGT